MAEEVKKPETIEIATTKKDIDIFAGWITRLENPDPVLRSEASGKGLRLYDEVDRDPHAGSVLQTRYLAVVGKEWTILPGLNGLQQGRKIATDQDQEIADFVAEVLEACNFDQARHELLQALLYGFYCLEVMWKIDAGAVAVDRFFGKHPRRFIFSPERELRLLTLSNMIEGEILPPRKFIQFTCGDSDNPYGKGLGQKLWWPVWFKKNGIKFWLIFLDKFGGPTAVGKYPPGTGDADQQKLLDAINLIHTETGVTIPENMAIDLLEAARAGQVSYQDMCEYMDKAMSKAVLGQTATTEGTPGKLGNEQTQGEVRQDIIEADADLLDTCLNNSIVRWIVDFNFPGIMDYPKIETFAGAKPDLQERSAIDKTLVVDIGLPVGIKYFYETYGIPEPEEGEELVSPNKMPGIMPGTPGGIIPSAGFAEPTPRARQANAVPEKMAVQLGDEAGNSMDGMIDKVKDLVMRSENLEAVRDGVYTLFKSADLSTLGEVMQQALVLADLAGRFEVKNHA